MKKLFLVFFVTLFLALTPINLVLHAEEGSDDNSSGTSVSSNDSKESVRAEIEEKRQEIRDNIEKRKKETKERIASRSAERKEKLEEKKLKICEKRKGNITNRANKVAERIEKHFNRFGVLVTKVDNFYTTKLVPKGVVVENYAALKADIETQKSEVQGLLTTLKSDIAAFDCASDSPKSQLETVKTELKNVHLAMKDYRTSLKNFIKAIKNAVEEKKEASSSAEID